MNMFTALEHLIADRICNYISINPDRRYNAKGQPVFMVAALGVVLDIESNTMKTFGGIETKMVAKNEADESKCHMDDILSLDISTDRKVVVTG